MSSEFNELLPDSSAHLPAPHLPLGEKMQIWLIGSREQVQHSINEFYVKRIATDRAQFTPITAAPLFPGKFMSILER